MEGMKILKMPRLNGPSALLWYLLLFSSCHDEQTVVENDVPGPRGDIETTETQLEEQARQDSLQPDPVCLPDPANLTDEDSPHFRANLSGTWISRDKLSRWEIKGDVFVFTVKGEYPYDGVHPETFQFDTRHPWFEYSRRCYRVFYEGSKPTAITFIWKDRRDDDFNKGIVLIKESEKN